jgi:hypothetical protein
LWEIQLFATHWSLGLYLFVLISPFDWIGIRHVHRPFAVPILGDKIVHALDIEKTKGGASTFEVLCKSNHQTD